MTFTKFWEDCIAIFGTRSRKEIKATVSTSAVKSQVSKADQLAKSVNQLHREMNREEIKAQTEVIE